MFTGVLGLVAWAPPGVHLLIGGLLTIAALAFFHAAWADRASPPALRTNLLWGLLVTAGAMALVSGLVGYVATPLLALAGICAALAVIAKLGETGEPPVE